MSSPETSPNSIQAVPSHGPLMNSERPNVAQPQKFIGHSPCLRQLQNRAAWPFAETSYRRNKVGQFNRLPALCHQIDGRAAAVPSSFTGSDRVQRMPVQAKAAGEISIYSVEIGANFAAPVAARDRFGQRIGANYGFTATHDRPPRFPMPWRLALPGNRPGPRSS